MVGTLQTNVRFLKSTINLLATFCTAPKIKLIQSWHQVIILMEANSKFPLLQQKYQPLIAVVFPMMSSSPAQPSKRARIDVPSTPGACCILHYLKILLLKMK